MLALAPFARPCFCNLIDPSTDHLVHPLWNSGNVASSGPSLVLHRCCAPCGWAKLDSSSCPLRAWSCNALIEYGTQAGLSNLSLMDRPEFVGEVLYE